MVEAKPARRRSRAPTQEAPRVAVVGGGLAGLTAALRLKQRGFRVTLYEKNERLGGNLSSEEVRGIYHDVYPHMFCAWYANFWNILENDLGVSRDARFEARTGVKLLYRQPDPANPGPPQPSDYKQLENATTLEAVMANLRSGVLSPAEMFLLGFSMLDLATHAFNRSAKQALIDRLDVNGFIYSRGYTTENVAALQNQILMVIWSIQSDVTAAASYQDFIKHTLTFPRPTPFCWLLKGDLYRNVILPFERRLEGCIERGAAVTRVELEEDGKPRIWVERSGRSAGPGASPAADYVVLAVPGPELARLVMTGAKGRRIVDRLPELSGLQRFQSVAIPVVDVYFKKKLPDIPKEQVGFAGSDCDLSMLDISQLWVDDPACRDCTALVLAASDGDALPSLEPLERGHMMIRKLHEYLPCFEPGAFWGDENSDICWEKTHYRSNDGNKLFLNDVGSWGWRPQPHRDDMKVFFAGDFCQTDVDMATVEAAVQSGLKAAKALQELDAQATGALRGEPITMVPHEVYSDNAFLAAKLALLPAAYAAAAWADLASARTIKEENLAADAYAPSSYTLMLPLDFAKDWWTTAYWLAKALLGERAAPRAATELKPTDAEIHIGIAQAIEEIAAERLPPDAAGGSKLASAVAAFAIQAARTVRAAYGLYSSNAQSPAPRRRARVKP